MVTTKYSLVKKIETPPLLGHAWSRGRMFLMSDSHVVPMCLTICPKNSHSVSVFNYLSKRTPMVTMCLTLCPKRTPTNAYLPWSQFNGHNGVFPGRMKFYFSDPTPSCENFFGAIFFGHDGVFPGRIKFYFPSSTPHARISLVRFSLVTTAYSLV